jgi:hypothetical protein
MTNAEGRPWALKIRWKRREWIPGAGKDQLRIFADLSPLPGIWVMLDTLGNAL